MARGKNPQPIQRVQQEPEDHYLNYLKEISGTIDPEPEMVPDNILYDNPKEVFIYEEPWSPELEKELVKAKVSKNGVHYKYIINQSLIKKIIDKYQNIIPYCPKYIRDKYLLKILKDTKKSRVIQCGNYMEYIFLGGTAEKGKIPVLERSKTTGKKRIDEIRIELQYEMFQKHIVKYGMSLVKNYNTQIKIYKRFNDDVIMVGTLDWGVTPFTYPNGDTKLAFIDLKSTGDVTNTFGDFCWGSPEHFDLIQGDYYNDLIRNIDFDLNDKMNPNNNLRELFTDQVQTIIANDGSIFLYMVYGIGKDDLAKQFKLIERSYYDLNGGTMRQKDMKERLRKTYIELDFMEKNNWEPMICPNCMECSYNKTLFPDGICELATNTIVT